MITEEEFQKNIEDVLTPRFYLKGNIELEFTDQIYFNEIEIPIKYKTEIKEIPKIYKKSKSKELI